MYKIGEPLWNEDFEMFEVKIGLEKKGLPLRYSCWGKTEREAKELAAGLVVILKKVGEVV